MLTRRTTSLLFAALAIAALAPAANAQGRPAHPSATSSVPLATALTGPARDAYTAAKLLMVNNDFQGALTKFQQAYDLSKDPRLLFNMAICEKDLHAYARMQRLLEQYEREAGDAMPADQRALVDSALAAIKGLVGAVKVTLSADGATVALDGESVGTSPLNGPILVDLGKHTLSVHMTGFEPVEKALDVSGGGVTEVVLALTPTPHLADVTIAAEDGAAVAIDGKVVGSGQFHGQVASGPHTVRVTEGGKVAFVSEVVLRDGETRTLEVTLREDRHPLIWPWVVGGVVVAAGAVVGGYFLFQPSSTTTAVPPGKLGVGSVQLSSVSRLR